MVNQVDMERKILNKLYAHSSKKEWTVVIGARQIGKSTVMRDLATKLVANGKIVVQLNLERRTILDDFNTNPDNIFLYVPETVEKVFVLIDEIQYLDDPSNFLKHIYDEYSDRLKLIVTGSSAFYIDKNFNDSLAGRKKIFNMFTFDFEEYLAMLGEDNLLADLHKFKQNKLKKLLDEARLWSLIDDYAIYGGYPNVIMASDTKDKVEVLEEIKNSFVKKDVHESGVREDAKFYHTMHLMADQAGNLVNTNELSNSINAKNTTIEHFLYVMQKCFHIHMTRPFHRNLRKELIKMPKVYFHDTGLRNSFNDYFHPMRDRLDKGTVLENFVFTTLRNYTKIDDIKYWRTADGNEVDFIIDTPRNQSAMEVKFNPVDNKISKYKLFKNTYPDIDFSFVNWRSEKLLRMLLASNIYE